MLDLTEKQYVNKLEDPKSVSDTIVIDNGSYELRAGYLNNPCIIVRNKIFKNKLKYNFLPFSTSIKYSMFEYDVIVNFEILDLTLKLILEKLKPEKLENLILTVTPFSPTKDFLINFLFTNYSFNKIQLGYDFIYSYHKNFDKKDCLVISISNSSVIISLIKSNKIKSIQKINFGINDLKIYIKNVMLQRYKDYKKNYENLINYIRVSDNYEKESVKIYQEICNGNYQNNFFLTDSPEIENKREVKKIKQNKVKPVEIPEIDYFLMEKEDKILNKEEIKSKRRHKLLFFSTLARLRLKIKKSFKNMTNIIENTKDTLEKEINIEKFIKIKKEKFENLKRDLKMRENLRKFAKNRKSREFIIKNKENNLTQEELEIQHQILDAEDLDQDDLIISKLNLMAEEIKEIDPDFIPFYANTVEILRGNNIGRQCVNIDLIRWPEIFFYPSIVRMSEMGISEILENLCKENEIENVLICGGLAKMKNLKKRIFDEILRFTKKGKINIKIADDINLEAFNGAKFSDLCYTVTREEWKNKIKE